MWDWVTFTDPFKNKNKNKNKTKNKQTNKQTNKQKKKKNLRIFIPGLDGELLLFYFFPNKP